MVEQVDVLVIGGGVNGVGIARDAAGRGLSVWLCERDDLAAHTSSASTKLIHGGLRYLEQFEFALVGKALAEREVLLRAAPHIIWPLRFVLPHQPHLRPAWMIRLGLFLYDHLGRGRRTLPGSRRVRFGKHVTGEPLRDDFSVGFVYSDAWVQDARLVVLNAMDAARRGVHIETHTRCVSARRDGEGWTAELEARDGSRHFVKARALVNAAGPWAASFLDDVAHVKLPALAAPDQGQPYRGAEDLRTPLRVHLPATGPPHRLRDPLRARLHPDRHDGHRVQGRPLAPDDHGERKRAISATRRTATSKKQLTPNDVVWSYSGVRPLLQDEAGSASEVTRDYLLDIDQNGPPLLNVFGGKLTTYRKLSEEAVDKLAPCWATTSRPGPPTPARFPVVANAISTSCSRMSVPPVLGSPRLSPGGSCTATARVPATSWARPTA